MTIHLNRSASRLVERELLPFLRKMGGGYLQASEKWPKVAREARRIEALFTAPKPSIKKQQARKKKKLLASGDREAHRLATSAIYLAVEKRAGGYCECGCRRWLFKGGGKLHPLYPEMDHFYLRAKEPQTVENCWLLAKECHEAKGANLPNRAEWDRRFHAHCERNKIPFRPRLVKSAALSVTHQKGVGQ